jgi:hypothetical protein
MLFSPPAGVGAQDLADYDYEHLTFRGIGLEAGYIFPSIVENTWSAGARFDLGFLGPGLRLVAGVNYWSSDITESEVSRWEQRLLDLVQPQQPPGSPPVVMDLGTVGWTDYSATLDGHFMWEIPFGLLTYTGLGLTGHYSTGSGEAIKDTFVEDLLNGFRVGVNAHAGLEIPLGERVRLYGNGRFEFMGDLYYFETRGGLQVFLGSETPSDHPRRGADPGS